VGLGHIGSVVPHAHAELRVAPEVDARDGRDLAAAVDRDQPDLTDAPLDLLRIRDRPLALPEPDDVLNTDLIAPLE